MRLGNLNAHGKFKLFPDHINQQCQVWRQPRLNRSYPQVTLQEKTGRRVCSKKILHFHSGKPLLGTDERELICLDMSLHRTQLRLWQCL